jgi:hypothetical protein
VNNLTPWYTRGLFLVVITTVAWFVWKNVSEISHHDFTVRWLYLIPAALAAFAFYLVNFVIWRKLARSFGLTTPLFRESKAFFVSQLGKYVPGKVTLLLLRLDGYRGYSKRNVVIATGVEMIASLASWCLIVASLLVFMPSNTPNYIRYAGIGGVVVLISLLNPKFLKRFVNWILRLFGRECMDEMPSYGVMLRFVAVYMLGGVFQGLVLYFVLNSFFSVPLSYYPAITAASLSALLIGIAAVFAPGGLGVREGILIITLPMVAPKPIIVASVVATRLLLTLVEVFLGIIATLAARISLDNKRL